MNLIEICNLALDSVGRSTIQSINEDTREAQVCKLRYGLSRDFALADFDWGFARTHSVLPLTSEEYPGWDYAYARPSDCLAPRWIYNSASKEKENAIPFDIGLSSDKNTNLILTDQQGAVLIYTTVVTNTSAFSPAFSLSLSWRLAAEIAIPLCSDLNLAKEMKQNYATSLASAKAASANTKEKVPQDKGTFYSVR